MIHLIKEYEELLEENDRLEKEIWHCQVHGLPHSFLIEVVDEIKARLYSIKMEVSHVVYMGIKWMKEDGILEI